MAIAELSATANDTYIGGSFCIRYWEAGDSTLQCGHVASRDGSAAEEVLITPTTGIPLGVMALIADLDIDTAVTAGVEVPIYLLKAGTMLRTPHDTSTTAAPRGGLQITSTAVAGTTVAGTTAGRVVGMVIKDEADGDDIWLELIT